MLLCCALTDEELLNKNEKIEWIIERLGEGDISAMDELYRLVSTDIYAFALSKTGNSKDAEDIMQDTFVRIYQYSRGYEPQGKPLAWIFTIVSSLANRKFIIDQRCSPLEEPDKSIPDGKEFENSVIDAEFLKQLMKVLTQEEQQIIVLHIVSGMKHIEIARLLNKPISTVLSRYNRAIKKLKKVA